ncbi:MAG: sensor histidine kinase [Bacteroidota bacterium]
MKFFAATILAFVCASYAHAQVVLTDSSEGEVVHNVYHFCTTDKLDILALSNKEFTQLESEGASLGYDKGNHWYRFDVENRSSRAEWFLEVGFPLLDHVEFYSIDAEGKLDLQYSGDLYKISTRAVHNKNIVFPFYMKPGTKESFYLKVITTSAVQVPLTIWSAEGLRDNTYWKQFANGLFYGIILIMIAYNLFLFISIRDKTILYYVFALTTGGIVIAYFNGYGFFYLNPEWPELNRIVGAIASPAFIISSVALTRSFLELKRFSFWLDRTLIAVGVVAVIFSLLKFGLGDYISNVPMRLISLVNFFVILTSAVYCFMKNFRPARYFLLAWGSLLVLGILLLLRNVGLLERSWVADNSLYVGGILQVLLISFAFGDRFSALQRENIEAKERALLREHQEKERLEREVELRTEEIRLKNAQLEESNNIKNKLFSIVSHDLRGPLISLQGILDMVSMDSLSPEDLKKYTDKVGVRLHHTADFLDNLLQWSRMQMQGEKIVIAAEKFPLQHLLISSTQVLRAEADRKHIRLSIDAPVVDVYADMNMMQTVVRNLVSNALKFTHPAGKVDLTAMQKDGFVHVRVSDSGIGIAEENIPKLFTLHGVTKPGTQLEKGTGIGLAVCKEFVERNGGTIRVESKLGDGTTFEFTIPTGSKL